MVTFQKSVYRSTATAPDQEESTAATTNVDTNTDINTNTNITESPRELGNAGQVSVEDITRTVDTNTSGRRIGTDTSDLVTAPGYYAAENTGMSKEEADMLYAERIEDEYAKREGGA